MNIVINGKSCTVADNDAMLIDVVRDVGLTGTKLVCGGGVCGAGRAKRHSVSLKTTRLAKKTSGSDATMHEARGCQIGGIR